ncbi:MAG: hypothetical protein HYY24_08250 [Verrucomicrobia bacterium]|nr:hypothetical protein [Verrucomicrobiota bacterium]
MENLPPSPASPRFPTFARLFRWFLSWRILGRVLIGIAVLVTLIGIFYAEENWRGRRAWNQYRRELEAHGAQLDWQALWPKPVPDDQNFAATPVIKTWFDKPYGTDFDKRWKDNFTLASKSVRPYWGAINKRQFMDLVAWERAFAAIRTGELNWHTPQQRDVASNQLDLESRARAAAGVLEGLKTNEAIFAELQAASRRPFARYPFKYDTEFPRSILVPSDLFAVCARLELRACAELAAGQSGKALEDVNLILYLADSLRAEPILFGQWDRIFYFQRAVQPIWEGLAERAWSPPQLQELAALLQRADFLADCKLALEGERAAALWTIDRSRRGSEFRYLFDYFPESIGAQRFGEELARLTGRTIPSGWFEREKIGYCRLFEMYLRSGFEPSRRRVSPVEMEKNTAAADELYRQNHPSDDYPGGYLRAVMQHRLAAATLIRTNEFVGIIRRFCFTQATADQAALACALEQHRLAHGQFPEKLEALTPQFISQLPTDVITGETFKYRRTDDGRSVLYSIGWNEKDDGGTIALNKDGGMILKDGDWVWEYPAQ